MDEKRGSIAFFSTYRPPVPLDIFSLPIEAASKRDELSMTDGVSYNYNGQIIPPVALKAILKRPKLASKANDSDVDSGHVSGMIFVSERSSNLETLHVALRFSDNRRPEIFGFSDLYDMPNDARMEDSGCFAGENLIYVSTKEDPKLRRQPWTAVFKTNLETGITERLAPRAADLKPSVSPSGKRIAVASFQRKGGWDGEIKDLRTDIYVMNVEKPRQRTLVIENGGWPTWGSDDVLFFHRNEGGKDGFFGVYRADISQVSTKGPIKGEAQRVTPEKIDAATPAAIDATKVAVAIIRKASKFGEDREAYQYRHIEVFDSSVGPERSSKITPKSTAKADHFNPFVIDGPEKRIGYHRCVCDRLAGGKGIERQFNKIECPKKDVGLFRVSGVFPTFNHDGSKIAFVDNEFQTLWVADDQGLHIVHQVEDQNGIFSPVWNSAKDILYICVGPSFDAKEDLEIQSIQNPSAAKRLTKTLTTPNSNNAFPSTNKDGTKFVFRSRRDDPLTGRKNNFKNLYIMEDQAKGEFSGGSATRITFEDCTDTHCQWSPNNDWIVFSSTRDNPDKSGKPLDNGLDPGYFAVYMLRVSDPTVVIRVMGSGRNLIGHVNHPFFSPDGKSIVVTSDLAAVSVDPISLPLVTHSVRPYGDIFTIDIDPNNFKKNKDVKKFTRITHSRYENSTATWTESATNDPHAKWSLLLDENKYSYRPTCPYLQGEDEGESWHMTGQLVIPKACC